jgi:hypothetical protein
MNYINHLYGFTNHSNANLDLASKQALPFKPYLLSSLNEVPAVCIDSS